MERNEIAAVQDSFGRCLTQDKFFDRFYEIFIASHPDIRPMFARTDMAKQKELLRHGLMSALMFVEDDVMAKACIDRIRGSHGHGRLNIRPELYRYWLESILRTVSECDPGHTPEVGQLWRQALQPAVEHIKSGYQT
ncbi:MAG: globin [Gammaproteobacteria bacterium]|nr:globin [Gammaproteobacteria bacterium]